MYMYLARLKCWSSFDEDDYVERVAVAAESFTQAMEYIENYYKDELGEVLNLVAISDCRLLVITEDMEKELHENGLNCF